MALLFNREKKQNIISKKEGTLFFFLIQYETYIFKLKMCVTNEGSWVLDIVMLTA